MDRGTESSSIAFIKVESESPTENSVGRVYRFCTTRLLGPASSGSVEFKNKLMGTSADRSGMRESSLAASGGIKEHEKTYILAVSRSCPSQSR